ncbi:hypothetical protein Sru01_42090 [Sphaerisporangium rufum]|uniref:site-specific DNA-methyltransferase (adenine-specific) n=1 Tax=Sphaerisporangium rufum TaxID=1381558 RepID=A0A919V217_9ACTN|nr:DNA methyltransferase [Sphaerisporangium rufum]GII79227.1 hypothetical protein Sru01_42090 [Sphaerisporangium rufum]
MSESSFSGVQIVGGLFPNDLLNRVRAGDPELPGIKPAAYHLTGGERLGDAAARKWQHLRGVYESFRAELAELPASNPGTRHTRQRWVLALLDEFGFGRLSYRSDGLTADGRGYPIGFLWEHVPVHIVGWHVDLDRRHNKQRAPQSLFQEFLNTAPSHLWGILSNGRRLRIMRDSTSLVGSSYIEFDLEAIFEGNAYSEFFLLYAFLHQSRFEALPRDDGAPSTPADCRLEQWRQYAIDAGVRFNKRLRGGVARAIELLGSGFRQANPAVDKALSDGTLTPEDYRHDLLRLVYQLLFVFVAEERGVLLLQHDEAMTEAERTDLTRARARYHEYFSSRRLRRLARIRQGDRHSDLWRSAALVLDALGADRGLPELALPGLGGLFFPPHHPRSRPSVLKPDYLRRCELSNSDLLAAVYELSVTEERGRAMPVDFKHLGAEELGSVYESLLELRPDFDPGSGRFLLQQLPGSERKTTGSFYTPAALIESLLDSALDPVIERAARSGIPDDLLKITVCDPACGSGHFLVAAARRIAKRYAELYEADPQPTPRAVRHALRRVIGSCVYGVDINPLAVEIAKWSLWMESVEPGKPLSFLDGHIKTGNSLLGATPRLILNGVPDDAFKPLPGDDAKFASQLRAANAVERGGQQLSGGQEMLTFGDQAIRVGNQRIAAQVKKIIPSSEAPIETLRERTEALRKFEEGDQERLRQKVLADAWCAAFAWPKRADEPRSITTATLRRLYNGEQDALDPDETRLLADLTDAYAFFHWYVEFPEVFDADGGDGSANGWSGGFSCVLGNPPWERVKLQEQEFFAVRAPEIAKAPNAAARKKMIDDLLISEDDADRLLHMRFAEAVRRSADITHLLRDSGRYPLTGHGDINTYSVFAETARTVLSPDGAAGLVLPTGIATDATTAPFFGDLVKSGSLASFLEFENEAFLLSRDVDHRVRFCLLTMAGPQARVEAAPVAFGARRMSDLPSRMLILPPEDIMLVNPNTGTMPLFRSKRDAEITFGIYRRVPVLIREAPPENPWHLSFLRMFDMANDSRRFRRSSALEREGWTLHGNVYVKDSERMLPLYEAKMVHHFDHRFGTYDGQTTAQAKMGTLPRPAQTDKDDPDFAVQPRYWVSENEVRQRLGVHSDRTWLLGWRDICRSTDERTLVVAPIPVTAVGHKFPLAFTPRRSALLQANLSAFVVDYCVRQKMAGTSLTFFIFKQIPVLSPADYEKPCPWQAAVHLDDWISERVLELNYTSLNMAGFAQGLGSAERPFRWDEARRFAIRCELDAAYFHLYGVAREDVEFIMDGFGAFQRNDPERFARTKAEILAVYDAMTESMDGHEPYQTSLLPPPGQGPRHPAR